MIRSDLPRENSSNSTKLDSLTSTQVVNRTEEKRQGISIGRICLAPEYCTLATEALRTYRRRRDADLQRVLEFARTCRVANVIRPYLEAGL